MKRHKHWLGTILAATMVAQLAIVSPLPSAIVSAAADPVVTANLPDSWSAVSMYASESSKPGEASAQFANNQLSMSAAAGKIDSSGDNVVYSFMPVIGNKDFTFTARISAFVPNPSNAWAALMVKDGSDAASKMVALGLYYSSGSYQVRDYRRLDGTGGGTTALGTELGGPVYLRIQRTDNNLAFSYSTDGGTNYVSRTNFNNNDKNHYTHLNLSTLHVGLAVSAGSAVFDQITWVVDGQEVFDSDSIVDSSDPPSLPDGLVAVAKDGAVDLSWNTVTGATYYQIKGGTADGGPYPLLDEASGTTATIDGLTNGVPYYFVVNAGNTNGLSDDSEQTSAIPTGLTVPGLYELSGFATYASGGGVIPEDDPSYRKITNAAEFHDALQPDSGAKVIEIMNDLDLGWNEIPESAKRSPFAKHNEPLLHPILLKTGVSKITIDNANGLTIFSRNGSAIRHASLVFRASTNIVIRNLKFDELWEWDEATNGDYDRNDWDYISLESGTSKVWIDHATFGKSYDGVVDAKGGSNGITISWSRFEGDDGKQGSWVSEQIEALDRLPAKYPMYEALLGAGLTKADIIAIAAGQKKGHLIGASELAADNAELAITLHHNLYTDMMDRIPRLRAGNAHVYNIVVNNTGAHNASKRLTPEVAAAIAEAGYHFGVTSNGAISTEGGAVFIENSVITDVLYPLRNNQKEDVDPRFTGAIKATGIDYSLDGATYSGDSDSPDSPLAPMPAEPLPFAWNTASGELPYLYEPQETPGLSSLLSGANGSGAGAGELYWSTENWLSTSSYSGTPSDAPEEAPTAPSGLLAIESDGEIQLRWGEVGAADRYNVYRSESSEGPFDLLETIVETSYTDLGVSNGVPYYYVVRAVNDNGESNASIQVTATPRELAIPSVPAGVTASGGSTKISVSWQASNGTDYYVLYRRVAETESFVILDGSIFEHSFEDRTAAQGITYEYAVAAVNAAGASELSAATSASLTDLTELSELRMLLEDHFDDQETGAAPQHYAILEESGTLTVAELPSSTDKSIRFFDDRSGIVLGDRTFEGQTAIAGASFDFMQESKANSVKVFRLTSGAGAGSTSNSYAAVAIETNGGHLAYRTNGGYVPFLMNYEAGVWYAISIVANLATGKADIYVDGELALEQIGLFNTVADIAVIQSFTANNNSANAYYLDNVRAYGKKNDEPGSGDGDGDGDGNGNGDGELGSIVLPPQPIVSRHDAGAFIHASGTLQTSSDGRKAYIARLTPSNLAQAGALLDANRNGITMKLDGDPLADRMEVALPLASLMSLVTTDASNDGIILELHTVFGRYQISTKSLWSASDLSMLESMPEGTTVSLKISTLTGEQARQMEIDAEANGIKLVSQAIDFAVSIQGAAGNIDVTELPGYAARYIPLPEGYESSNLAGAVYDPATGSFSGVPSYIEQDGDISFIRMLRTGNSIYAAVDINRVFDDLSQHWSRSEVEWLASRLFIEGVAMDTFSPDENVTRAQFAAMLVRAFGLYGGQSSFTDIDPDAWYAEAVAAAERFGLVTGYDDGTFRPDAWITREQITVMLSRALKQTSYSGIGASLEGIVIAENSEAGAADATMSDMGGDGNAVAVLNRYLDAASISKWARSPLADMVRAGILQGTPAGMLQPGKSATRSEAAVMLSRLLFRLEQS
ncbi:S-layer homology domain-containing protein [Paenibacillus sp. strain BS8-2]